MNLVKGLIAGVIAVAVLALVIPRGDDDEPQREDAGPARASTVATTGALRRGSSADRMPVFSAANLSPGTIVEGTATIANTGRASAYFSLSQADLTDVLGPRGGVLSKRLTMEVRDVTRPGRPVTVYEGPYAAMDVRPLGFIRPGTARRYSFTAIVAQGDGEAFTGSSTSARYVWSALEGAPPRDGPAQPPPRDRRPPRLRVEIPRVQRLLSARTLNVRLLCSEDCRVTATGGAARRLRGGRTRTVRIAIPRARLRALRRTLLARRTARVRLTFTALDAERNRAVVKRTVRLKPRPR
jgi:hypothetical protein